MQNKEIHYNYAIATLLLSIILLIAFAYFDTPNLVDKFSFALTLSSLLLAILAIFYTIISANKQDSHFAKIIEATSKLNISTDEINKAAVSISSLTKDMPDHFNSINSKIDGLQVTYKALSDKDKKAEPTTNEEPHPLPSVSRAIAQLQFRGMAVLYFFTMSSYKGKTIEYDDFDPELLANGEYAIGFLNAFQATGLIGIKLHKGSIISTYCDTSLYKNLKNELDAVISAISPDSKGSADYLSGAITWVDKKLSQ